MTTHPGQEQNWYPVSKVGWFTRHLREGIEVSAEQLRLLQPALAQPYRLDDATVARIIRVHQDQADDLVLFQNQAGKWNAVPGLTAAQQRLVQFGAAGELAGRLVDEDLLAADRGEGVLLGVGVLVAGGDPSIADPHGRNRIANVRQFYEGADTTCVTSLGAARRRA